MYESLVCLLDSRTSPVAPQPWGAYNATKYRDICVQNHPQGWDLLTPGESEDCLYIASCWGCFVGMVTGLGQPPLFLPRPLTRPRRTSTSPAETTSPPPAASLCVAARRREGCAAKGDFASPPPHSKYRSCCGSMEGAGRWGAARCPSMTEVGGPGCGHVSRGDSHQTHLPCKV